MQDLCSIITRVSQQIRGFVYEDSYGENTQYFIFETSSARFVGGLGVNPPPPGASQVSTPQVFIDLSLV